MYSPPQQPPSPAPTSEPAAVTDAPRKRTLFSAIIDSTVQVDRVTRQSIQTVKHTFEPPHISALRSHRQKMVVRAFYAVGSLSFFAAMVLGINALTHSGNSKPVTSTAGVLGVQTQNDATRNGEEPAENKPTTEDIST